MSSIALQTRSARSQPAAKLKPKEHGAYAILAIPLICSLSVSGVTFVGVLILLAAISGFLAHEPLMVALGHRGNRARRNTPAAKTRLTWLLLSATGSGGLAVLLGAPTVRLAMLACLLLACASFAFAYLGLQRSLTGQLMGVVGLSAPCVPILLAGGLGANIAIEIWCTWLLGFSATTIAVRGVIANQKGQSGLPHWLAMAGLSICLVASPMAGSSLSVVILPMLLMSWYLILLPPPANELKRIGWTLVGCTIATAIWMIATFRLPLPQ